MTTLDVGRQAPPTWALDAAVAWQTGKALPAVVAAMMQGMLMRTSALPLPNAESTNFHGSPRPLLFAAINASTCRDI